jgi:hypothetical protein
MPKRARLLEWAQDSEAVATVLDGVQSASASAAALIKSAVGGVHTAVRERLSPNM